MSKYTTTDFRNITIAIVRLYVAKQRTKIGDTLLDIRDRLVDPAEIVPDAEVTAAEVTAADLVTAAEVTAADLVTAAEVTADEVTADEVTAATWTKADTDSALADLGYVYREFPESESETK